MERSFTYTIEVGDEEFDVTIDYSVFGSYRSASFDGPEEYPETNIISVRDENGKDWLPELDRNMVEKLEEQALENADNVSQG